jgi:2-oxoisovalerate dehydrogenase E1 component
VLLLGEDLHDPYGGAFKVSTALSTQFPDRVLSTPISEAAVIGTGIGLALAGYRPIAEVMFADFVSLGMDQLYNHAVKFPGLFEDAEVPLVVRTPCGGRRGYGPTHSQSPENLLTSIPGLTVLFGSHRHDCGRLLKNTVARWPYPTVFLEHKLLYGTPQDTGGYVRLAADPDDPAADLFPTLLLPSPDPDLTFVTFGGMVSIVEEITRMLQAEEELACEIVAPSLLSPLPRLTLLRHLLQRKRVVVVEESHVHFGVSSEVGATLLENDFQGKFLRVGTPPVPIPAARSLEAQVIPGKSQILEAIQSLF